MLDNAHDVILSDSRNCDICGGHRLVAALGLDNLLIPDTPDALLVAHKDREQEVKSLYNRLKSENREVYHHHRSEHWVVVSGTAEVTCSPDVFLLNTNESGYIKAGQKHSLANRGLIDLVVIEVQSGDYLGEDDIVRFDDCYGREVLIR